MDVCHLREIDLVICKRAEAAGEFIENKIAEKTCETKCCT